MTLPVVDLVGDGPAEAASRWLEVLALGVVQGVTEFLPVSSSGHLVLAARWMEVPEAGLLLGVALHVGTLGAVFAVYGRDVLALLRGALGGELREPGLLLLGSLPAAVVGIGFHDAVERAFRSPAVAAVGLLATSVLLLAGHRARLRAAAAAGKVPAREGPAGRRPAPRAPAFGAADALWMGLAQAVAITPGISRSGSTIAAGLLRGRGAHESARFSFLLSIIAIGGGAVLESIRAVRGDAPAPPGGVLLAAVLVSALVGWAALKGLLVTLERGAFLWFGVYCALAGTAALVFLA